MYLFPEPCSTYFLAGWLPIMLDSLAKRRAKADLHICKLGWAPSHVKGVQEQKAAASGVEKFYFMQFL